MIMLFVYGGLALLGGFSIYKAYRGYVFYTGMKAYIKKAEENIQAVTEKICG